LNAGLKGGLSNLDLMLKSNPAVIPAEAGIQISLELPPSPNPAVIPAEAGIQPSYNPDISRSP